MQLYNPRSFVNASFGSARLCALFGPESNGSHVILSDEGIAAAFGEKAAFAAVLYATTLHMQFSDIYNRPCIQIVADGSSCNWEHFIENPNWQIANMSSPCNFLSALTNAEDSAMAGCNVKASFPFQIPPLKLTANLKYGGWNMQPLNAMFIDGPKDPWHTLSTHSSSTEIGVQIGAARRKCRNATNRLVVMQSSAWSSPMHITGLTASPHRHLTRLCDRSSKRLMCGYLASMPSARITRTTQKRSFPERVFRSRHHILTLSGDPGKSSVCSVWPDLSRHGQAVRIGRKGAQSVSDLYEMIRIMML